MWKKTLNRHSFRTNLLLFLATLDDFLGEISYDNVYKQLRIPGYQRRSTVEMVRRMLKAKEIEYDDHKLTLSEKGKSLIDSFMPVKKYASKEWDGLLRLIIFDIPESKRLKRDQLRQLLKLYGYGQWQKSVYLTPHPVTKAVNEWLEEAGLSPQAICFESKAMGRLPQRDLAEMVFQNHHRTLEWQNLIADFETADKTQWVRRWEKLVISDPWLPNELESREIPPLRLKAGELMKQLVK